MPCALCHVPFALCPGPLSLVTKEAIKCRGVRIRIEGKSVIHWHTGSGDDRNDYHGEKSYLSIRQTVWGSFVRTQLLNEAGKDAYYNQATGGGNMYLFQVRVGLAGWVWWVWWVKFWLSVD